MSNIKNRFIVGTEGKPDYLVIAQNGSAVLGIKGIVLPMTPKSIWVGMRIRSVSAHKKDDVVEHEVQPDVIQFPTPINFADAWPGIEFDKKDDVRASTEIGLPVNRSAFQIEDVIANVVAGNFMNTVLDWLTAQINVSHFVVSKETVGAFLAVEFTARLTELKHNIPLNEDQFDDTFKMGTHQQGVVSFVAKYGSDAEKHHVAMLLQKQKEDEAQGGSKDKGEPTELAVPVDPVVPSTVVPSKGKLSADMIYPMFGEKKKVDDSDDPKPNGGGVTPLKFH